MWHFVGASNSNGAHGIPPVVLVGGRHNFFSGSFAISAVNDVVVNVSDIGDERDVKTLETEPASSYVPDQGEATVTEVWKVIDRRATDVH